MTTSSSLKVLFKRAIEEVFNEECFYYTPRMLEVRFYLVSVAGSIISIISVIENLLLFFLIARFQYAALMQTISHIAMTSGTFLIIAATMERYLITLQWAKLSLVQNHRRKIAIICIMIGVISKASIYFEYNIIHHPNCTGQMYEWEMKFHSFADDNTVYHIYWRLWYRNAVTIIAPFFVLLFLNIRIVTLQTNTDSARDATRTLICVITSYLISNFLNVILTFMENTEYKETILQNYPDAYAIIVDVVSLLTTAPLKEEIFGIIRNWCKGNKNCQQDVDVDEELAMSINSIPNHTVTESDDCDEKLQSVSSPQDCNGCIVLQDLPEANVSANQQASRQSIDISLTNTNIDSSAGIKLVEKTGGYNHELQKLLNTGKETPL
ncbi:hypothetical protein PRIPAC_95557 [Pristionchus pacificus]|uniref:Uncharacterized protein n=1 Tax=Pristionchus pacificus TaxID=54126 RepID=A0A2A6BC82_PRIPA|nr:hypothetical protein PRIPAC_95557 [Pristionchus pacificus]|eukprot:PDM63478.1 hypothetical protein PRIPAC_53835 [Pristionchus pacificus]